jgi:hypothetical protein
MGLLPSMNPNPIKGPKLLPPTGPFGPFSGNQAKKRIVLAV